MAEYIVTLEWQGVPRDLTEGTSARTRVNALGRVFLDTLQLLKQHSREYSERIQLPRNRSLITGLLAKGMKALVREVTSLSDIFARTIPVAPSMLLPASPLPNLFHLRAYLNDGDLVGVATHAPSASQQSSRDN